MAEKSRYFLEDSVDELNYLKKNEILDTHELTEVVRRRTTFEQKITRRQVKLQDFLHYIQFESQLQSLKDLRLKRLKSNQRTIKGDKKQEHASEKRIYRLYDQLCSRFPESVSSWLKYANYAISKHAWHKVSKIYAKSIKFHPGCIILWQEAITHTIRNMHDLYQARLLCQQGLKLCNTTPELWMTYFDIELEFINKLSKRKKIIEQDDHITGLDDKDQEAQLKKPNENLLGYNKILEGAILDVVIKHAFSNVLDKHHRQQMKDYFKDKVTQTRDIFENQSNVIEKLTRLLDSHSP